MFAEYIQAALEKAEYEIIDNPDPYYAHVPGLVGVWATGKTFEECRKELIEVIEEWIVAKLQWGQPIPPMGTSSCQPVLMCDKNGQNCSWFMVCK